VNPSFCTGDIDGDGWIGGTLFGCDNNKGVEVRFAGDIDGI